MWQSDQAMLDILVVGTANTELLAALLGYIADGQPWPAPKLFLADLDTGIEGFVATYNDRTQRAGINERISAVATHTETTPTTEAPAPAPWAALKVYKEDLR